MELKQERFLLDSTFVIIDDAEFFIPISLAYPNRTDSKKEPEFWMKANQSKIHFKIDEKPYLLNYEQAGYFR